MAGFRSIAAVGLSIARRLNQCFADQEPVADKSATAALISTEDFTTPIPGNTATRPLHGVSIFLYRVDVNQATRGAWSAAGSADGRGHLPLDLHFLITPWSQNAQYELQILGRTMQALETTPILSGAMLHPSGDWEPNEAVHVVLGELSTEAVMRTFDSLPHDYKLSVPYIARVVRIDSLVATPDPDTLTVEAGLVPSPIP